MLLFAVWFTPLSELGTSCWVWWGMRDISVRFVTCASRSFEAQIAKTRKRRFNVGFMIGLFWTRLKVIACRRENTNHLCNFPVRFYIRRWLCYLGCLYSRSKLFNLQV